NMSLKRNVRAEAIDQLLANIDRWRPHLGSVLEQVSENSGEDDQGKVCSWEELHSLKEAGASIGGHSSSHIKLIDASPIRLAFEVNEVKRIIDSKFGDCEAFAYPFGTVDEHNGATARALKQASYQIGFLTRSAFANADTDRFH